MNSQFDAVLNDVLLLFDNLILLRMICLGRGGAGNGGVQRADAVSTARQLLWKFELCSLAVRWMLLTWNQNTHQKLLHVETPLISCAPFMRLLLAYPG